MPLTIIAALEELFPDLSTRETIKFHLICTSSREVTSLMIFEELLHLLPSLESVELTCVGLDVSVKSSGGLTSMKMDCCPKRSSGGRTRSLDLWTGSYHDYIKTDFYQKPDLAVVFHTGLSQEMETQWFPTLKHLAAASHPTLFTSYNKTGMGQETLGYWRARSYEVAICCQLICVLHDHPYEFTGPKNRFPPADTH